MYKNIFFCLLLLVYSISYCLSNEINITTINSRTFNVSHNIASPYTPVGTIIKCKSTATYTNAQGTIIGTCESNEVIVVVSNEYVYITKKWIFDVPYLFDSIFLENSEFYIGQKTNDQVIITMQIPNDGQNHVFNWRLLLTGATQ